MKFSSGFLKSKITLSLFILFLFYHCLFNSFTGQFLFETFHPYFHTGNLKGDVKRFSLLYGVEIENIVLAEKDSNSEAFLTLGRFAFIYSLPSILIGSIYIEEIGLESIRLVIQKKNSKYNFESIFPVSQMPEEEKAEDSKSDSIYTGLYIKLYTYLHIKNFNLSYEDEDTKISLEDLSLHFLLETKRINNIYFDHRSLDLIKNFSFEVQPSKSLLTVFQNQNLYFKEKIGFYILIQAKGEEMLAWNQTLLFELKNLIPSVNNQAQNPLNLQFSFLTELSQSKLNIKQILLVFQESKFLEGNGSIENVFDLNSSIHFHLTNSNIDLNVLNKSLEPYKFPISNLSGNLRLSPIDINGNLGNFIIKWSPEFSKINLRIEEKNHSISSGTFQTQIQMGIKELGKEKKVQIENASLQIDSLKYNSLLFNTLILYQKKNLSGTINILDLNLNQFDKSVQGILGLNVKIENSNLNVLHILLKSEIKNFQIPVDSYNLKPSNLKVQSNLNIVMDDSFKLLKIELLKSILDLTSYRSGTTIILDSEKITYNKLNSKLNIDNLILKFYPEKMVSLLPYTLGEKLSSAAPFLGNEVTLKSSLDIELNNQKHLKGYLESKIPGIQLNDLKTNINLELNSDGRETIRITEIQMDGFEKRLSSSLKGNIFKQKIRSPDLNFEFRFQSETKKSILSGIEFKGKLESQINIQETSVNGTFSSENSNFFIQKGNCPGKDCKFINIINLNCSIPFLHESGSKTNTSILDGNKETLIQTKGMEKGNNFFIESISANHPIYPEKSFSMIQGNTKNFGITARIDYISNLFSLSNLTLKTLNGSIGSKNIQFNIGDGDPLHFEFLGNLQIRDIDLTELIPTENKIGIDDGKIRGDINFSGKNLKDIIDNTDIYFSVYKIGKDFGKSAINIVSPPNLIRDYIVSSYSVDRIETELSKGLIYVHILFKPSLLSNLLTKIENNKISMERMPLNNFMNRAENEISKYK